MQIKQINIQNIKQLKEHICSKTPSLYTGSQTSTVIPFDRLPLDLSKAVASLSGISPEMELNQDELTIRGAVDWKMAKDFCVSKGRQIMTSPTEELALVISGVATSCTGERCFGFGTMRDQIVSLKYLDHEGNEKVLHYSKDLMSHPLFENNQKLLKSYQELYKHYEKFKNAPFPRLEKETDLMTGTEGQLGIVTELVLKTVPNDSIRFLFMTLPKWEEDYSPHMEIFEKVQSLRNSVFSCELIDSNSLSFLKPEDRPCENQDVIFLEVKEDEFENVFESLLSKLTLISDEQIFEMPSGKFHQLRMNVPRAIFEKNSQMGVVKKGTDVQSTPETFSELLDIYRGFAKGEVGYNLFGHFGDAHLHFNFMPTTDQVKTCENELEELYKRVKTMKGSPFAEHGIGLIKQKYIQDFYEQTHKEMFKYLKDNMDPGNIFFPEGFMANV